MLFRSREGRDGRGREGPPLVERPLRNNATRYMKTLCEQINPGPPRFPAGQNTMAGPEWIGPEWIERIHRLGHRKVTIPPRTRWLTPAGLGVSTRNFSAFVRRQNSMASKPRDAFDTPSHAKRLKSGLQAQNHGTHPKRVPCSETPQNVAYS